jgi:hypothetical protein
MLRVENVAALTATSTGAFFVEARAIYLLTRRLHHEKKISRQKSERGDRSTPLEQRPRAPEADHLHHGRSIHAAIDV